MNTSNTNNVLGLLLFHYGLTKTIVNGQLKVLCPFHGDRNPSMLADTESGTFHCFACGARGDSIEFVQKLEKINSLKAAMMITKMVNGKDIFSKIEKSKEENENERKEMYDAARDFYFGLSRTNWCKPKAEFNDEEKEALLYMKERGFSRKILNVAKAKVTYARNYKLVFPIVDNGKFAGWLSRTFDKEIEKKRKYLYNKGFRRATTIAGNYGTQKSVIIVEGYMDMLKLRQAGIDNVAAILGWHISTDQIKKLKDAGITVVVSALDNDDKGRQGTELLRKHFKVIKVDYPDGVKDFGEMDKNEIIKTLNRKRKKR